MAERAGFVGLGQIGAPMARNLLTAGFELVVLDVRAEATAALAQAGATVAEDTRELGRRCAWLGVCVRDDAQAEDVVLGAGGVLAGAAAGSVLAVHSTVHPRTVRRLAAAAAERGVDLLDAPVTGGAAGAAARRLCMMVGGDVGVLERARPFLSASAARLVHAGPVGSGTLAKLCNNLMTYQAFQAAYEAWLLAREAGLAPGVLEEVTQSNGLLGESARLFLAMRAVADERVDDPPFQELLRGLTGLAEKDLALALEVAREAGVALPGAGLCQQTMARVYGLADTKRR